MIANTFVHFKRITDAATQACAWITIISAMAIEIVRTVKMKAAFSADLGEEGIHLLISFDE
ncbi:hypothetical protein B4U79_01869 [Dinothrombium tinctorium]|uniref:Uncharacterized protein n=1 Tax=Dinothrombium tinctorium TaxID=1965070 RepID=A0A443REW5_9ACAR|nr:hypothetical protein B4U79_01869 [Dinothrombium tinctorium]